MFNVPILSTNAISNLMQTSPAPAQAAPPPPPPAPPAPTAPTPEPTFAINPTAPPIAVSNPFDNAIHVSVTFKKWGNSAKADKSKISTQMSKEYLRASKTLLISKRYTAIISFCGKVGEWIRDHSLRSIPGVHLITPQAVPVFRQKLEEFLIEFNLLVDEFINEDYDPARTIAQSKLGDQWDASRYPSKEELRKRFAMTWLFLELKAPDALKEFDEAVFEEEKAKLHESWRNETQNLFLMMRNQAFDDLKYFSERLAEKGSKGKKPQLRPAVVNNMTDFLDFFDCRNAANDDELRQIIEKAKLALKNAGGQYYDREQLATDDAVRASVRDALTPIVENLDSLVKDAKTRRIVFAAPASEVADGHEN